MNDNTSVYGELLAALLAPPPATDGPPYTVTFPSYCQLCEDEVEHEHKSFTVTEEGAP